MKFLLWVRDRLADLSRLVWPSQEDVLPDANERAVGFVGFVISIAVLLYCVGRYTSL